jgi:hypothetical protein
MLNKPVNEQERKKNKTLMKVLFNNCKESLSNTIPETYKYFYKSIDSGYYDPNDNYISNIINLSDVKKQLPVNFVLMAKRLESLESIVNYFNENDEGLSRINTSNLLEIIQFLKDHYVLNAEQQADLDNLLFHPIYLIAFCWYEAVTNHKKIGELDHFESFYNSKFLKYTDFSKLKTNLNTVEKNTNTELKQSLSEIKEESNDSLKSSSENKIDDNENSTSSFGKKKINKWVYVVAAVSVITATVIYNVKKENDNTSNTPSISVTTSSPAVSEMPVTTITFPVGDPDSDDYMKQGKFEPENVIPLKSNDDFKSEEEYEEDKNVVIDKKDDLNLTDDKLLNCTDIGYGGDTSNFYNGIYIIQTDDEFFQELQKENYKTRIYHNNNLNMDGTIYEIMLKLKDNRNKNKAEQELPNQFVYSDYATFCKYVYEDIQYKYTHGEYTLQQTIGEYKNVLLKYHTECVYFSIETINAVPIEVINLIGKEHRELGLLYQEEYTKYSMDDEEAASYFDLSYNHYVKSIETFVYCAKLLEYDVNKRIENGDKNVDFNKVDKHFNNINPYYWIAHVGTLIANMPQVKWEYRHTPFLISNAFYDCFNISDNIGDKRLSFYSIYFSGHACYKLALVIFNEGNGYSDQVKILLEKAKYYYQESLKTSKLNSKYEKEKECAEDSIEQIDERLKLANQT